MRARWFAGRSSRALVVPLMLAAALAGLGPGAAAASACGTGTGAGQPVRPGSSNGLAGVAVASCQAWAVGNYTPSGGSPRTLIEHWDGTAWRQVPSPSPGAASKSLYGVKRPRQQRLGGGEDSFDSGGSISQPLVEHWDGTAWTRVPTPSPGGAAGDSQLAAVAATSASNAWAVGASAAAPAPRCGALVEHWDGTTWTRVPTLNPGGGTTAYYYRAGWPPPRHQRLGGGRVLLQ